jgi:DNA-binding LytR/AlgR family response regulator
MPRAVIAEDEKLLRDDLVARLAAAWPALEIAAACEDGGEALEAIAEHQPDVAFLDIRMPGLTGLEVAAASGEASPGTRIVFVTAYNQYAIEAFDRGAVDYLLKPIDPARLAQTVKRLEAVHARHVDVEEEERRLVLRDDGLDVASVFHLAHHVELRPQPREARAKLRAQERLVVGDDRRDAAHAGTSIEATTPCGARSSITRRAEPP